MALECLTNELVMVLVLVGIAESILGLSLLKDQLKKRRYQGSLVTKQNDMEY